MRRLKNAGSTLAKGDFKSWQDGEEGFYEIQKPPAQK
jgi:hypothetical protein